MAKAKKSRKTYESPDAVIRKLVKRGVLNEDLPDFARGPRLRRFWEWELLTQMLGCVWRT